MQKTIHISEGVTRMPQWRMNAPVNIDICDGEHIAIVGDNGSGKTMLTDILIGRHPLLMNDVEYDFRPSTKALAADNIKYITFRDSYGGDNDHAYYLQQRWNQHDIDESTPTTGQLLESAFLQTGADTDERRKMQSHLYALFGLKPLLNQYIILLSSGELRKFQLTRALFSEPRILILDNPFIGLDATTREQLRQLLRMLINDRPLQLILILAKQDDMPDIITHVIEVKDMVAGEKTPIATYLEKRPPLPNHVLDAEREQQILSLPERNDDYAAEEVVKMHNVSIRYGSRTILKDLNWTVRNGERWALSGANGSGKSTLLSLVCADNTQSYACDITLFGHQRGSGETIWDIKKHIGYVSPEMHRAYKKNLPAIRIVASGLKDSVGLYVKPSGDDYKICRRWMHIFGLDGMEDRNFLSLSSGEQRLVLLARAFVKDPELLILDEPLHGLDDRRRRMVKDIIETFCHRRNKTLMMVTHYEEELPACITHRIKLP